MKRVAFLVDSMGISGGNHIIYKWAEMLSKSYEVSILVKQPKLGLNLHFIKEKSLNILSYEEAQDREYDLVFATWWETLKDLILFQAGQYAFLMQSLESCFYSSDDIRQSQFQFLTEKTDIQIVTIASWLKNFLVDVGRVNPDRVQVVKNGIDKKLWAPTPPAIEKKTGQVRFMVEGPGGVEFKHIKETIAILEEEKLNYIWVSSSIQKSYIGKYCEGYFEKVPYQEMPRYYSSCDVLLKLSSIEGMFGPPLEMMSTGGTAVVWDVYGSDEYVCNGVNAIKLPMYSKSSVASALRYLSQNSEKLNDLKKNALESAKNWCSWEEQESKVLKAVETILSSSAGVGFYKNIALFYREYSYAGSLPIDVQVYNEIRKILIRSSILKKVLKTVFVCLFYVKMKLKKVF